MSSSCRAKTDVGTMSPWSFHSVLNSDDAMCEILLLLPPETIFQLIMVSKRWLQLISTPQFRYFYLQKWHPSFYLVGFFICNSSYLGKRVNGRRRPRTEASLPLLSTTIEGDEIESSGKLKKLGYYIDSSNGFLLCGRHPKAYYLWDPSTQTHDQLPRHRVHFEELCMSLITEEHLDTGYTYKVVRAECVGFVEHSSKVRIETYSSITNTWSYSELSCSEPISLTRWTPGQVIEGVIFWHATGGKVAIYDTNDENKQIDIIRLPRTFGSDAQILGETSDGCLKYGWSKNSGMEIWKLDKVTNDLPKSQLQWNILYTLNFKMMWRKNPPETLRFNSRPKETQLLAFIPKKESFYIRCDSRIFIYHKQTGDLEEVQYQGRSSSFVWDFCKVVPYFRRCWPSLPQQVSK